MRITSDWKKAVDRFDKPDQYFWFVAHFIQRYWYFILIVLAICAYLAFK